MPDVRFARPAFDRREPSPEAQQKRNRRNETDKSQNRQTAIHASPFEESLCEVSTVAPALGRAMRRTTTRL
jgi:hypothetical protein